MSRPSAEKSNAGGAALGRDVRTGADPHRRRQRLDVPAPLGRRRVDVAVGVLRADREVVRAEDQVLVGDGVAGAAARAEALRVHCLVERALEGHAGQVGGEREGRVLAVGRVGRPLDDRRVGHRPDGPAVARRARVDRAGVVLRPDEQLVRAGQQVLDQVRRVARAERGAVERALEGRERVVRGEREVRGRVDRGRERAGQDVGVGRRDGPAVAHRRRVGVAERVHGPDQELVRAGQEALDLVRRVAGAPGERLAGRAVERALEARGRVVRGEREGRGRAAGSWRRARTRASSPGTTSGVADAIANGDSESVSAHAVPVSSSTLSVTSTHSVPSWCSTRTGSDVHAPGCTAGRPSPAPSTRRWC